MTVQPKPTDPPLNQMTWAESGPSPIQNSNEPSIDPALLQTGYGNRQQLPHVQFNWLMRAIMRWIQWLVSKVDGHVHDGGPSAGSVSKVNATNHLDWGANGTFGTTANTPSLHEITHGGSATTKKIVTGQFQANQHVISNQIRATGTGQNSTVSIKDYSGGNATLEANIIKAPTRLEASFIRADLITVQNSSGNSNAILACQTVRADNHLRTPTIRSNNNSELTTLKFKTSDNTFRIGIDALNAPIAVARIGANASFFSKFGNFRTEFDVDGLKKNNTGTYEIQINVDAEATIANFTIFANHSTDATLNNVVRTLVVSEAVIVGAVNTSNRYLKFIVKAYQFNPGSGQTHSSFDLTDMAFNILVFNRAAFIP